MQGPHDFYKKTQLKAVLIQAEIAANDALTALEPGKPSLWARIRSVFTLAAFRPVTRRA